jgi:hypothetical protein
MGEASAFKSGREFCAWLGLVPTQTGTGGKVRLGSVNRTNLLTGQSTGLTRKVSISHEIVKGL